jgi:cyclophilin family peptidyl-prolyl cis-trans isomerase
VNLFVQYILFVVSTLNIGKYECYDGKIFHRVEEHNSAQTKKFAG